MNTVASLFLAIVFTVNITPIFAEQIERKQLDSETSLSSKMIQLISLNPVHSTQPVGKMIICRAGSGKQLQINDRRFDFGISATGNSEIIYILNHKYKAFDVWVGLDAEMLTQPLVSAVFQIFGDGNKIFDSGLMQVKTPAKRISVNVSGINELQLKVVNTGTGGITHADWAEPILTPLKKVKQTSRLAAKYEIRNDSGFVLKFDSSGNIVEMSNGSNFTIPLAASTRLVQCTLSGTVRVEQSADGSLVFTRDLQDLNGKRCTVTDRFTPTKNSIRWDVDITSNDKPWTTAILTSLQWPVTKQTQFWTAWSSPDMKGLGWRPPWNIEGPKEHLWQDPLETRPFCDSSRWYGGNPLMGSPTSGDCFSIPIYTIIEHERKMGFSLVQSPDDTLLQMKLLTTADGTIEYQRRWHRLGLGNNVHFTMDLVCHEDDWRSGLAWAAGRHADYFEPVNQKAYDVGGCGAYTSWEGELDAEKCRKMAFRFNWKASFDFPYMGMFIPPVDQWQSFTTPEEAFKDPGARKENVGRPISAKDLRDYGILMRQYGFHVLNYFNVTEFGTRVKEPLPTKTDLAEADLWKNSSDFLYNKIADGIMYNPLGKFYRSWGGAIITDCGGKDYQAFLLEQAKRHIDLLPEYSGICIDRMDWLRLYNMRADDGISWYEGKPARSLLTSWKSIMDKIGPMMHDNDKIIFANPYCSMRLDVLKHVDGIYSEHNELGPALNTSALLGIRMPVTTWTVNETTLRPNPDFFFQSLLYMGVFPTAPLPLNNHTIIPSEFADKWYLDYGPLFKAILGRKWVLLPNVISVNDNAAKANIFEIAGGYAIPVTFGKEKAAIQLDNLPVYNNKKGYKIFVLHPGSEKWTKLDYRQNKNVFTFDVPLKRGCAMVKMLHTWIEHSESCFVDKQTIKLGTLIDNAEIRYSLDGSKVSSSSTLYKKPFTIDKTTTINMAVFVGGKTIYQMYPREFVKTSPAWPTIESNLDDALEYFKDELEITLSSPVDYQNSKIYYTTDGSLPTERSNLYRKAFKITDTCTVKAITVIKGHSSAAVSKEFLRDSSTEVVPDVFLSDLEAVKATSGYRPLGPPKKDSSISQQTIIIAGRGYEKGIGVTPYSELIYDLKPEYKRFVSSVGVDDAMKRYSEPSLGFEFYIDDHQVHKTPVLRVGDCRYINVEIPAGSRQIKLVVTDGGDGIKCDHADWAMAGFLID